MVAYFKNYTKPRNKFCTQHMKFPRVTARDAHVKRRATKGTTSTFPLSLPGLIRITQSKTGQIFFNSQDFRLLGCDAASLDN